jgi:hypothetical protein
MTPTKELEWTQIVRVDVLLLCALAKEGGKTASDVGRRQT